MNQELEALLCAIAMLLPTPVLPSTHTVALLTCKSKERGVLLMRTGVRLRREQRAFYNPHHGGEESVFSLAFELVFAAMMEAPIFAETFSTDYPL